MGASLCSLRRSSSSIADHHDDHDDHQELKEPINQTLKSSNTTTSTTTTTTSTTSCLSIGGLFRQLGCLHITDHDNDDKKRTEPLLFIADVRAEENISEKKKLTTLEDWIMDSPAMNKNRSTSDIKRNDLEYCRESGELYASKHLSSRKIHPSSSSSWSSKLLSSSSRSSSSRSSLAASRVINSVTLDPVVKTCGTSCSKLMSKSKSERFTKKVSFKEEHNVISFYSPES